MSSVTISDMQNFVENMTPDIKISSNVGNIIEIGGEDLGDDLGASLLTNITNRQSRPVSHSNIEQVNDIGSLEPLEAISFDIPSESLPEFTIHKNSDSFSNDQTSTGPSINLASANRMNPEEERKKNAIDMVEDIIMKSKLEDSGISKKKDSQMSKFLQRNLESMKKLAKKEGLSINDLIKILKKGE